MTPASIRAAGKFGPKRANRDNSGTVFFADTITFCARSGRLNARHLRGKTNALFEINGFDPGFWR